MRAKRVMLTAVVSGAGVLWALPTASIGQENDAVRKTADALRQTTGQVESKLRQSTGAVDGTVRKTTGQLRKRTGDAAAKGESLAERLRRQAEEARRRKAQHRVTAGDPQVQPPLRGTNPHGQGSVAVTDLTPSAERPFPASQDGKASGEEIIAGRARGEQNGTAYHGHITILALFGTELAGVDTNPGESRNGPLQPLQQNVLDPICTSTNQQACLSVLTANSATTTTGSTNDFAVARANLGGLSVGAAESNGTIAQDANCQTSTGTSRVANVASTSGVIAGVTSSSSTSRKCKGQAEENTRTSSVVNLGGTGIGVPAAGCANGTPDTRFQVLSPVATVICNADEETASGTRQALDVFALSVGGTSLVQESTAQAESKAVAPGEGGAQCSDGTDNDGDGMIDSADPGCHRDNNPNNPASFDPNDNDEANAGNAGNTGTGGNNDDDDNGNGNGNGSGGDDEGNGNGSAECSDGRDNDGDGVSDEDDPGCHSDGNADNPASYRPNDDDESNGGTGNAGAGPRDADDSGSLPFTGSDVLGMAISGLLLLGGGLVLRRREQDLPH